MDEWLTEYGVTLGVGALILFILCQIVQEDVPVPYEGGVQ